MLACQSELRGDIEVEVEMASEEPQETVAHFPGTIARATLLTHDIVELIVRSQAWACGVFPVTGVSCKAIRSC